MAEGKTMRVLNVVGTRPNFIKIASVMEAMRRSSALQPLLVHTGQHYDERMSQLFFRDLGIPEPDLNLGVAAGSHAEQTGRIMIEFEKVLLRERPDLVLVVGDVNSTLACALTAAKLQIPVAHVEAGLRSFDRTMPEEINRLLTDRISDYLFVSERSGVDNLRREGVEEEKIFFVGNVMIDTLLRNRERAAQSTILGDLGLVPREYLVLTLHRPSNVDKPETLRGILEALREIQAEWPILFPVHPRTRSRLAELGLTEDPTPPLPAGREGALAAMPNLRLIEPLGYLDFLQLMAEARVVLTDSGGIQEETTVLGVPCVTLRENTERPVTLTEGTNVLAGTDPARIVEETKKAAQAERMARQPALWDGKAAERIVKVLEGR